MESMPIQECQSWSLLVTGLKEEALLSSNRKAVLTLIRMGEGLLRFKVWGGGVWGESSNADN